VRIGIEYGSGSGRGWSRTRGRPARVWTGGTSTLRLGKSMNAASALAKSIQRLVVAGRSWNARASDEWPGKMVRRSSVY